jgi:hypothetical protein
VRRKKYKMNTVCPVSRQTCSQKNLKKSEKETKRAREEKKYKMNTVCPVSRQCVRKKIKKN